jgi:hypothetical protein
MLPIKLPRKNVWEANWIAWVSSFFILPFLTSLIFCHNFLYQVAHYKGILKNYIYVDKL